jgi:TetR/AcrR family transcriptional regulator, transcriptional repressor for nem operon
MPAPTPQPRSKTAEEILDIAEFLIQTRGYSAFSYQDISVKLGIRKASIHYHYPTKAELGCAVVERYVSTFEQALAQMESDPAKSSKDIFEFFTQPFFAFADTPDRICLCGALAGEILALPLAMREMVDNFFVRQQAWLTRLLKRGLADGSFQFSLSSTKMARTIFGALHGALLVKRATGHANALRDVVSVINAQLTAA